MTQGIWISDGKDFRRPKSKREIKDTLPERIKLESAALFSGSEFHGLVSDAPVGTYFFVGPDPYNNRRFYGQVVVSDNGQVFVK